MKQIRIKGDNKSVHHKPDSLSITALREGQAGAYKELYDLFSRKLYAFAFSYFKSKELSEEIVHDVFVKIWNNKSNLREDLSLDSYIFTIAKNLIIDTIRKNSSEALYKKELKYWLTQGHNTTEDLIIFADYENIAKEAIAQLPPKRKAIFNLSRQQHMTYAEIAQYMGISQKTVEAQMNKALKFIKDYLHVHADIVTVFLLLFLL